MNDFNDESVGFEDDDDLDFDDGEGILPHEMEVRKRPDLQSTLDALRSQKVLNSTILYGLSKLSDAEITQVEAQWHLLPAVYRRGVMRQLVETSETNFELDYSIMGRLGLRDEDPVVRSVAIDVLWIDDSMDLMALLIQLALNDPSVEVRAAATSALGRFILAGELGELADERTRDAEAAALHILTNSQEDIAVRRRALEAIANCSHPSVEPSIRDAYNGNDDRMRISALFAMGRTADQQWAAIILEELKGEESELLYEAVRAAGELELASAVPTLGKLVLSEDREIQEMAIWSLGEIGGSEAMRILNALAEVADENEDAELQEAIEEALANANLASFELDD